MSDQLKKEKTKTQAADASVESQKSVRCVDCGCLVCQCRPSCCGSGCGCP